jgi:Gluconate 2-dehydrogenase subunit 3
MDRRELLKAIATLTGGTIIGAEVFLSGCKTEPVKTGLFSAEDISLLDDIGETILPTTADSPGARSAQIGAFMKAIVTDCYNESQQHVFVEGLSTLQKACSAKYSKPFSELNETDKTAFLTMLDKEAKELVRSDDYKNKKAAFEKAEGDRQKEEEAKGNFSYKYLSPDFPIPYFTMIKQLTLWGYFTSEPGATKALRYVETPGHYDGAYAYKKGDKAFAL